MIALRDFADQELRNLKPLGILDGRRPSTAILGSTAWMWLGVLLHILWPCKARTSVSKFHAECRSWENQKKTNKSSNVRHCSRAWCRSQELCTSTLTACQDLLRFPFISFGFQDACQHLRRLKTLALRCLSVVYWHINDLLQVYSFGPTSATGWKRAFIIAKHLCFW